MKFHRLIVDIHVPDDNRSDKEAFRRAVEHALAEAKLLCPLPDTAAWGEVQKIEVSK